MSDAPAKEYTRHAACDGQDYGFHEELDHDVGLSRTKSLAQPDLAGPFGDGHEHYVHDADSADEQRDGGDSSQKHAHCLGGAAYGILDLGHIVEPDTLTGGFIEVAAFDHEVPNLLLRGVHAVGRLHLNFNVPYIFPAHQSIHCRCDRHQDNVIFVAPLAAAFGG